MKETKHLDLFGTIDNLQTPEAKLCSIIDKKKITWVEYCECLSKNEWVPFFTALIWPVIFIIFTILFYKKIKTILDEIGFLIGRIKKFKSNWFELEASDKDKSVKELLEDVSSIADDEKVSDENKQSNVEESPVVEELLDAYKEYKEKEMYDSLHALAELKIKIREFENKALTRFEDNYGRGLIKGVSFSYDGIKVDTDGLLVFEGSLIVIEVKLVTKVNTRIVNQIIRANKYLQENRNEISSQLNTRIIEVRGVLIVSEGTQFIGSSRKKLESNMIEVLYYNAKTNEMHS